MAVVDLMHHRRLLVIGTLIPIALGTLFPSYGSGSPDDCLFCTDFATADAILNVLVFAPFGASLSLLGISLKAAVVAAVAVSGSIEGAQIFIPGRDPNLVDLASNAVGCAVGFVAVGVSHQLLTLPRRTASWFSLGASLFSVCTIAATAALLQPSFPSTTYFSSWTPTRLNMVQYGGEILGVSIGPHDLPQGRLESAEAVKVSWSEGTPLRITVATGPPVSSLAPVYNLEDSQQRVILTVGIAPRGLQYRYRTFATRLRLHQPDIWVDEVPNTALGDTITIILQRQPGGHCIALDRLEQCNLGFTVGAGWALFINSTWLDPWAHSLFNACWLAALLCPAGFFGGLRKPALVGLAIVVCVLAAAPFVLGLEPTRLVEWVAVSVGVGMGFLLRSAGERLRPRE